MAIMYSKSMTRITYYVLNYDQSLHKIWSVSYGLILCYNLMFTDTVINVSWTVMNSGVGVTGVDRWTDRLYLSVDNQTSRCNSNWNDLVLIFFFIVDRNDYILGSFRHDGVLGNGSSYNQSESVTIPHAINGTDFFIGITDIYNSVYENILENDNGNFSQVF